jgi:hypothetical protein
MASSSCDPLSSHGPYEFVRVLKITLYGRVVLAVHRETGEPLALKYSRMTASQHKVTRTWCSRAILSRI